MVDQSSEGRAKKAVWVELRSAGRHASNTLTLKKPPRLLDRLPQALGEPALQPQDRAVLLSLGVAIHTTSQSSPPQPTGRT
jgi:hypothetical protein